MDDRIYYTRTLVILFSYYKGKLNCRIYRKGYNTDNWTVLQSKTIPRPGISNLDDKEQLSLLRQILKSMHQNPTKVLEHHLKNSV